MNKRKIISSLGIKPTKNRNSISNTPDQWLKDRQELDGTEGLWRVHDNLYDLTAFIDKHPGGSEWLKLTKGIDITEAYEVHHISKRPDDVLAKYFVKKAITKRNNPFTFHEDGFYRTLKKEVREIVRALPQQPTNTSSFFADSLLLLTFLFAVVANAYRNYWIGCLAAVTMAYTAVSAHNYFHKKDNFRMYYTTLTFASVRDYRIIHILSHHLYTNTIGDLQISLFEPFLIHYLPYYKSFFNRYGTILYFPLLWAISYHINLYSWIKQVVSGNFKNFVLGDLLPFTIPLLMLFSGVSPWQTFIMWNFILLVSAFYFGLVGESAAHHHPDIFHDGDTPRAQEEYDWGIFQLDAVMDKAEITGSHFLVLTNYGDHALHHMFPTLDHGQLEHLYPTFRKVMKDFNVELRMSSQVVMIRGLFQQLAKILPNPNPPQLFKKYI